MALLAPRFRSHALLGLPARLFSATIGLVAARAGPPGATAPRRAAARAAPAPRRGDAADAGWRFAPHARANGDRLAVVAATFISSRTVPSPPRHHAPRQGRARQRGPAAGAAPRGRGGGGH